MKNKKLIKVLSALSVLAVLSFILLKVVAEPVIKKKIKESLNQPGSNLIIKADLNIRWIFPGLRLKKILVTTSDQSMEGTIESISLTKISIRRLLFRKGFYVGLVRISDGRIYLKPDLKKADVHPVVLKHSLHIGSVRIKNIQMDITNMNDSANYYLIGLNANLEEINNRVNDTLTLNVLNFSEVSIQEGGWQRGDSLYSLKAFNLNYSGVSDNLIIDSIRLIPAYKEYEFTNRFQYETDCITGDLNDLQFRDISLSRLIHAGDVDCRLITIGELQINAFRDLRKPFKHVRKKLPQEILYDYQGKVAIDSIRILNGKIEYTEHGEDSDMPGRLFFDDIDFSGRNISNDRELKNKDIFMTLNGRSKMMGTGIMFLNFNASLFDPRHTFTVQGKLGELDMSVLNSYTVNNAFVKISGEAHSLDFDIKADYEKATGTLSMEYEDLKVNVIDKDSPLRDQINTWLMNLKVINSNPFPGERIRTGTIDYTRDPERSVFNYSIKSLMTGIKSVITEK